MNKSPLEGKIQDFTNTALNQLNNHADSSTLNKKFGMTSSFVQF